MLIHQVTDLHVSPDGSGVACENFLALMDYSRSAMPDLLAITGDLPGEDGSREAYEWIRSQLPEGIPCILLPGNHDDAEVMFDVFESDLNRNAGFQEHIALEELDLLFLNTVSSHLPDDQIAILKQSHIRDGSVLFVHHPPRQIADGYMDRTWPLRNRDAVHEAVTGSAVRHVFCGHFHCEYEIHEGYSLYLTPSPAFQVDLHSVEPLISRPRIPLREIEINGKQVSSRVRYLDG